MKRTFKRCGGTLPIWGFTYFTKQSFSGTLLYALKLLVRCYPSPPPPPFTSNKSDLAGEQGRDKGRWIEAAPSGLPAVSWKVLNNTALLVTEPTGKHELDGEQTEVLNLLPAATPHTCSTATVVLLQHPRLIRTASKKNMVIWTAHAHCSALHIRKLWIHDTVTSVSVH